MNEIVHFDEFFRLGLLKTSYSHMKFTSNYSPNKLEPGALKSATDLHQTHKLLQSGHNIGLAGLSSVLTLIGGLTFLMYKEDEGHCNVIFAILLSICGSSCSTLLMRYFVLNFFKKL